jgi:hypothetical protein
MPRRTRLAAALAFLVLTAAANADGFIRVDEDEKAARLQTAVTRYEKDGATVDLIGAVHIADKAYYETLTARFAKYEVLLFEMIGGERFNARENVVQTERVTAPAELPSANETPALPVPEPLEPEAPAAKKQDLSGLHKIYDTVCRYLQLTGQVDSIDYTTPNFVHADLTNEEFFQLQAERGESLVGFALKAGMKDPGSKKQPDTFKLLRAIISGSPDLVKLAIVHTLGDGDDQIAAFAGESVIITDRNNRCLEVMNREITGGRKKLGIFYGAAHFPDMEKRLLDLGFKRTGQEWITAWDIPKPAKKPASVLKLPS